MNVKFPRRYLQFSFALLMVLTTTSVLSQTKDEQLCKDVFSDEGIDACTRLISQNPKNAAYHTNRGHHNFVRGHYKVALVDLTIAIALNPKGAHAYWVRGLTWNAMNMLEQALADFKRFAELMPDHPEVQKIIASIQGRMKLRK